MFPERTTARLLLTEIRPSDGADVLRLFSDPRVVEHYDLEALTALSQAEALIQRFRERCDSGAGIRWAIRPQGSNELIGTCGFNTWTPRTRSAVVGYDLRPDRWGEGLASEALAEIVAYAFSGRLPCGELNRIEADTVPGNLRSERVLTRLGFKQEGLRREYGYWKNAYHDLKLFALLKREFVSPTR